MEGPITDVNPSVESSPAESSTASTPNFNPETYTPEQRDAWMDTGDIPSSSPAESAPAIDNAAGDSKEPEPATESAPVQQEHKGKGADARKAQLNAEIQELLAKRNALRVEVQPRAEAQQPAAPVEKKPATPGRPVKPVFGETQGETWDQYEARSDAYVEKLAEYTAQRAISEAHQRAQVASQNAAIETTWKSRAEAAQTEIPDWNDVVAASEDVPVTPIMDGFILNSAVGPKVLYELCKDGGKEGKRIASLNAWDAGRALFRIESQLSVTPKTATVTPITKAAKPATDLRAVNAASVDPRRAAIEGDDFLAYQAIENQRDIERRRRG